MPRAGGRASPISRRPCEKAPSQRRDEAEAELRFARAAAIHFQSVVNQSRYVAARDALADRSKRLSAEQRRHLREVVKSSLKSEIALARQLFPLVQEDSRIGFEAANQYFYVPLDLAEKVVNCRWLLEHLEKQPPKSAASQVHRQVPKFAQQSGGFQGAR